MAGRVYNGLGYSDHMKKRNETGRDRAGLPWTACIEWVGDVNRPTRAGVSTSMSPRVRYMNIYIYSERIIVVYNASHPLYKR